MGPGSPLGQILERWNQLPRARQMALAGIVAGTIVVMYFVFIASANPNLVVAYSGLAPEDSAALADQLGKDGIAYEVRGGGSQIAVPATKVAEARIKLAQAGLPRGGGIGLEIFDKTNFGATDFVQNVNFRRGLEGELSRSINTLDGVRSSRVHIVMPKQSLFKEDQNAATASVLLQLKPNAHLNNDQVRGITNLVTNSIEGMRAAGVTIMDETGHVLYDGAIQDSAFSGSSTQIEAQRQYEMDLQRGLENTLTKIVGVGRSAVTVRARLNFDNVKTTSDQFAPVTSPRSSVTSTETFSGNGVNVGQVPGTGANGGTNPGASTTANGNSTYSRTETTTNNELSRTQTTTVKAPGSVDRLSVSVVLDDSVTAAQESTLTSAIAAAVGLDQVRGDTLSVARLPFDASVKEAFAPLPGDGIGQYLSYLKLLLPLLAVVLGFVLVMLLLRSLGKRQLSLTAFGSLQALTAGGIAPGLPRPNALPALEAASDPQEERVLKLAQSNPRAVADVVQTWMREEER